jgi:hypothetical protein
MDSREWTIDDHLRGQPETSVALFHAFRDLLDSLGPTTVSVSKTLITFKGTRRGFAGAKPTPRGLTGYMDLQRAVAHPTVHSVAPYTKRLFVHHFRVASRPEMDDAFLGMLGEAYAVGQGAHITGR